MKFLLALLGLFSLSALSAISLQEINLDKAQIMLKTCTPDSSPRCKQRPKFT